MVFELNKLFFFLFFFFVWRPIKNILQDKISMYIFFAFFTLISANTVLSVFSEKTQEEKITKEINDDSDEKKLVKIEKNWINAFFVVVDFFL